MSFEEFIQENKENIFELKNNKFLYVNPITGLHITITEEFYDSKDFKDILQIIEEQEEYIKRFKK